MRYCPILILIDYIPKRWIVKRSFAWLGWFRRLAKDFEVTLNSAENFVTLAAI